MMNNGAISSQKPDKAGKNIIVCDVTNCVYNDHNQKCTASKVKVGPQFAASSSDTVCDTFKP